MRRVWNWWAHQPHPIADQLLLIFGSFLVGAEAQAGRLGDDPIVLLMAVALALIVIVDVVLLVLIGWRKLAER